MTIARDGVTPVLVSGMKFSLSGLRFSASDVENSEPGRCFTQVVRANQCAGMAVRCLWCFWGTSGFLGPEPSVC